MAAIRRKNATVAPTAAPTIRPTFGLSEFEFWVVDDVCEAGKLWVGDEITCVVCPGVATVPIEKLCEDDPGMNFAHCCCDEAVPKSVFG